MEENVNEIIDTNEDRGELITCIICGEEHYEDEMTEVESGVYICNDCDADNYVKCYDCGTWIHIDESYNYDGNYICETCFNDYYEYCNRCDEIHLRDEMVETYDGYYVCQWCADNYYFECYECNEVHPSEDACEYNGELYCETCYNDLTEDEDEPTDLFKDYSYKPTLQTYYVEKDIEEFVEFFNSHFGAKTIDVDYVKNDPLMHDVFIHQLLKLGFELETERNGSGYTQNDFCIEMHKIFGDFVYYKYDGSLTCGVEMVSHAFTLNWLRENENMIKKALDRAREIGYISHKNGHCGLHFHINRQYYMRDLLFKTEGDNYETFLYDTNKRDYTKNIVNKLNLFFETYKEQVKKFSRRDDFHYCDFLSDEYISNSNNYNLDTNVLNYYKDQKRYLVVNNQNNATIEIRVMRGTLVYETFMATCEFIFNLARVIENTNSKISWSKVVNYKGSKFIKDYCVTREIKNVTKYLKDYAKINETEYKLSEENVKKAFAELEPNLIEYGTLANKYSKDIAINFIKDFNEHATISEDTNMCNLSSMLRDKIYQIDILQDKIGNLQSIEKLLQGTKERFNNRDFDPYYLTIICDRLRILRTDGIINDEQLTNVYDKCENVKNCVKSANYGKYLQNA